MAKQVDPLWRVSSNLNHQKLFGHPSYSLDGPGPSITVSFPYEKSFNGYFGIWIGGSNFSDVFCRPITMHKLQRALRLRKNRVEQMPSLRHEVDMRQSRVLPGKYGMSALILALKESEIKAEAISVHMHQGQTLTKQLKYQGEIPTVGGRPQGIFLNMPENKISVFIMHQWIVNYLLKTILKKYITCHSFLRSKLGF